nr:LAG1 longevity assurance homolog 2 [Tanacetum cinerariifolium]
MALKQLLIDQVNVEIDVDMMIMKRITTLMTELLADEDARDTEIEEIKKLPHSRLHQHSILYLVLLSEFFFEKMKLLKDTLVKTSALGLSVWLMSKTGTPLKINKATRAKISKITESMWKFTYYVTLEFCVLSVTYREPWFTDITAYFSDFKNQELKFSLELVYMCQCGFYIYSIAALLLWETRRKDFSVMMSHHIVTVFLIGYSYITRFFRLGSVILAIHDASDVFLEGAKLLKYSVFHIYWWILIFNMIMRQLKNRELGEDIQSDSDDDN